MPKNRICEKCSITRANYGIIGNLPTHCAKCKEENMIYLTFKKCIECNTKEAKYNIQGEKKEYCIDCKKENMVFSDKKICIICKKVSASYGINPKVATHCSGCKENEMINVKKRLCIECSKNIPLYGYKSDKKPTYCKECKKENMIDIYSKKCEVCKETRASFGFEGKKESHCAKCKKEGMINVRIIKCIECKKQDATYNIPGKTQRLYCTKCKRDGMIAVSCALCKVCKIKRASFNTEGKEPLYCNGCKKENMVNVRSEKCLAENCNNQANYKYDKYCTWCFQHLFPEDPKSSTIYKKTLESEVAVALLNRDSSYKHDKAMFLGGCDCSVKRRIDFWKIIGNTVLAIEVDEKQHKNYDKEDEEIRYDDLYMAFSGKWIFIRFNPDSFKNVKGKLVRMKLKDKLPTLLQEIEKHEKRIMEEKNVNLLEIHNLFFDEI